MVYRTHTAAGAHHSMMMARYGVIDTRGQQFPQQTALCDTLTYHVLVAGCIISSASSGVLFSQAVNGAPYDIVLSADQQIPQQLAATLELPSSPFCYAIGQLVLLGGSFDDLENPNRSLAIANPATAPYGMAAMEVIARSRFSAGAARKLVRGGNALQAYQFWATGNVDLALVPRSLTLTQGIDIPPDWHQPIAQFGIALTETPAVANFVQWLTGNNTRQSITELGYRTCS
jgi:molybdate transport system substrate-binding protein